MPYKVYLIVSCCFMFSCSSSKILQNKDLLGQLSTPPDTVPQVFAKDIISTERIREGAITFSPDLTEIYYTSTDSTGIPRIMFVKYTNDN